MFVAILTIAATLSIGAMSPGPSFIMVARTSLAGSRADGFAAALGMGLGGLAFATAALLGLQALLAAVPALYVALKLFGGAYLLYLGYRMWRGARQPLELDAAAPPARRAFLLGFFTQVTNPKTAVVYASVFASLLPKDAPASALAVLPFIVFGIETGWYSFVAATLSRPSPRARYLASKVWIDRLAGAAMAGLGAKLVLDVRAISSFR